MEGAESSASKSDRFVSRKNNPNHHHHHHHYLAVKDLCPVAYVGVKITAYNSLSWESWFSLACWFILHNSLHESGPVELCVLSSVFL